MTFLIPCTVESCRVQTYPSSDAGSRHAETVLFTTNGSSLVSSSTGQFNWAARLGRPTGLINSAMRVINWGSGWSNIMNIYVLCSSVDNCLMARNFSVGDTIHVRCPSEALHARQKLSMHVRSSPRRSPFPHRYPTETHRPTGTPASVMPYTHSRCNVNLLRPPSAPPLPPLIPMPQRPPSGPKLPPSPPMPPMWPPFDETYNPLEKHR